MNEAGMDTFTLVFWVMMGWRFEETELPDLSWKQCTVYYAEMLRDRRPVRVTCMPVAGTRVIMPPTRDYLIDRCYICGPPADQPPPGHKRI
jgi:hypothetical protein